MTYRSATARDAPLEAISSVVNNKTKQVLSSASFSAGLADESTDIANTFQLVVHLQSVSSGKAATRFGGIVALDKYSADCVREALEDKVRLLT